MLSAAGDSVQDAAFKVWLSAAGDSVQDAAFKVQVANNFMNLHCALDP